jgi:hypothetical protein
MTCAFADALGRPGEGVHTHVLGVAVADVALAVALALALHAATGRRWSAWLWLALVFAAGVAAHRAFCVRTTVDRLLFG